MKLYSGIRIKSLTVTQRQLANALGISPARINQLVKDKIVIRDNENSGGAVFLYESIKRYRVQNAKGDENAELDLTKERAEHERTKRKIAELRLAKMERNVYSAKIVELVMTDIMDSFTMPEIHRVIAMLAAQLGKSETLNNVIGRFAHLDSAVIMMIQPTIEMAQDYSKIRIAPMLRDTKV